MMIKSLKYVFIINLFCFPVHLWVLILNSFNDVEDKFETISEARNIITAGIAPLIICSLIFIGIFSKKPDFVISRVVFLQALVILVWFLYLVSNYVMI